MAKVKVTLIKGLAGKNPGNKKTVITMGLRKIGQSKIYEKTPQIEGMLRKVGYLVRVEEQ
ncbi:MAG: 50S ribosomal protein L30 [Spirochaetia bacterium]|nr:50S ribosomal protein L30 [Spirochaetia bacterium]